MASTSQTRPTTGRTILSLLALASMASAQASSSVGCYSNATPLKNQGSWKYQSSGYCQGICQDLNQPVFALTKGDLCYCGDELPANSAKTDTDNCNIGCTGYGVEDCGGNNAFSVWLTGIDPDPPVYGGSSGDSTSTGTSTSTSTSTGAGNSASSTSSTLKPAQTQPTEVTSVVQGKTIVVTQNVPASTSTADSNSTSRSGGGTSVGAIAGGVVVAVLAIIGILAAIYFYMKRRKERAANEEYKRTQIGDFIHGGRENKPPGTAYSQMSDSRLDPEAGARRNSHGSIADNQDYSRRILRVANPDDS